MRTELKKGEKILVIVRQHWLKLVLPFTAWLLICVLLTWQFDFTGFGISLLAALYPSYAYFNWKSNLWCVTNLRVVDESGFFSRFAKESPIDKINNVQFDQSFIGRILGFGDVEIQTAAEMGDTTYQMIQNPRLLKDTITHAQEEYKQMLAGQQATQLAAALQANTTTLPLVADELNKLYDLFQKGGITLEEYEMQKRKLLGN